MGTLTNLLAQLDPDSKKRKGDQFERICKWFLENDPVYKARFRHVWHFTEWPGRWSNKDLGTDLVAEDYDGEFWAIQAKAYDQTSDVNHTDMGKFLADSNRTAISHRMLIATTEALGRNAAEVFTGQADKPVVQVMRSRLEAAQVDWPKSPADLRTPGKPLPPKEPRDYQLEAVNAVVGGFEKSVRGQLIMACGTGKTVTSLFVKEKLGATRTLVLVPSLSLLSQTMIEWTANMTTAFEHLLVCSDESVGEKDDDDAIVMSVRELGDRVTTDPEVIAEFLRQPGPRVVFSTYQSSLEITKAFVLGGLMPFDLIVADEAHRTTGNSATVFGTVLDGGKIPAQRRLFMTATPRYFTGSVIREASALDYEVATMNNEAQYGPVFHRLSFGEAISRDLLTDYQVTVIAVNDAEYRELAEKATWITSEGMSARSYLLAAQISLAKGMRDHDLRRVISFHRLVSNANRFADKFSETIGWMPADERPSGHIWAGHVDGKMTAKQRKDHIDRLRHIGSDERGLLSNARCLTEGVDVPALDGVIFVDPKHSEVDIVQAVGRAIRNAPNKKLGTIIIPVFVGDDEDHEVTLNDSSFQTVWWVVNALRLHDEELAEQLDYLRLAAGLPEGGKPILPGKIHFDATFPTPITNDFARAFNLKLVSSTTAPWLEWYGLILEYVETHEENPCVPVDYEIRGRKLGRWVVNQRAREAKLTEEQWNLLNALPGWFWNVNDGKWQEGHRCLLKFIEVNGHATIGSSVVFEGYPLGAWCAIQRRDGKSGKLPPERKALLDAIDVWVWSLEEARWERGFEGVAQFKALHGRLPRQQETIEDSEGTLRVGAWLGFQRTRKNQGKLEAERVARLYQLLDDTPSQASPKSGTSSKPEGLKLIGGWTPLEAKWDRGCRYIEEFGDNHQHLRIPKDYQPDGFKARDWLTNNRAKFHKLGPERQARLLAIPGWGDTFEARWNTGYAHAQMQLKVSGGIKRGDEIDGYPIGQWADVQRQARRDDKLSQDRIDRLDALKGWDWNPPKGNRAPTAKHDALWEVGFGHAQRYVTDGGVLADVTQNYVTDDESRYALGRWLYRQQVALKTGKMSAKRIARMDTLGDWK